MHRRKALATIGSLVSAVCGGCSGVEPPSRSQTTPTATSEPTATPPDGYRRFVSLENRDSSPEFVSLEPELVEPWITADQTARLDVTLTNRGAESRVFYGLDDVAERGGLLSDEGVVVGMGVHPPGCIGTDGKEPGPFGESGGAWTAELTPGNSVTVEFGVADDPRTRGCIPPGEYDFVWSISHDKSGPPAGSSPSTFRWGLSLQIRGAKRRG